jgi:hypothetical protein
MVKRIIAGSGAYTACTQHVSCWSPFICPVVTRPVSTSSCCGVFFDFLMVITSPPVVAVFPFRMQLLCTVICHTLLVTAHNTLAPLVTLRMWPQALACSVPVCREMRSLLHHVCIVVCFASLVTAHTCATCNTAHVACVPVCREMRSLVQHVCIVVCLASLVTVHNTLAPRLTLRIWSLSPSAGRCAACWLTRASLSVLLL